MYGFLILQALVHRNTLSSSLNRSNQLSLLLMKSAPHIPDASRRVPPYQPCASFDEKRLPADPVLRAAAMRYLSGCDFTRGYSATAAPIVIRFKQTCN